MAELPIRRTRRYTIVKFIYDLDDGNTLIAGQFHYQDENGEPFLPLGQSLFNRQVTDNRDQWWSDLVNLRHCEVVYEEARNQTGEARATFYLPDRYPNTLENLVEVRDLLKAKFSPVEIQYCTNYRGESRSTLSQPSRIQDNLT